MPLPRGWGVVQYRTALIRVASLALTTAHLLQHLPRYTSCWVRIDQEVESALQRIYQIATRSGLVATLIQTRYSGNEHELTHATRLAIYTISSFTKVQVLNNNRFLCGCTGRNLKTRCMTQMKGGEIRHHLTNEFAAIIY